ncbi:MAG: type IV pilus biogenesis/stability protein PilW [Gammaproteobacteria bacterium]|nr:type IV pilus biogenesis/stability protein PilW [Gammaproteobacteria bacterium]
MRSVLFLLVGLGLLAGCVLDEPKPSAETIAKRVDVHTQLGAAYLARNQLDVAQQELERALELDSGYSQAHNIMALLQIRLKDDSKAESHFKRAISEMPDNADARNNYGVFLCERNRLDAADEQFRDAIKNPLYRTPDQANVNAGICRLKKNDKNGAAAYFQAALQANPRNPLALMRLAQLSLEGGQALKARGLMQRYFEVVNDSPEALWLAYRIEHALRSKDAQASYAMRLRGKFPDSTEARQLKSLTGR